MPSTCPQCRRPAAPRPDNPAFPFCTERCRVIDLGAWLSEDYRVPVGPDETERDGVTEGEISGTSLESEEKPS